MKRIAAFALAALLLTVALVQAQIPAQRVIIVDPTGQHAASVSGGNLGTAGSASVTVDTISHITSATHVIVHTIGGVNVADSANTALRINCVTGCSASAGVTGSTHVSVALHVAGTINGAKFHVQGVGIPGQAHGGVLTVQGTTGMVPVNVDQNSKPWTISHISGSLHVAGISNVGSGTTAATTPMVCHSSVAFSTTSDLAIGHANSGMRIFICSIVLVAGGAESVSIVEGSGSNCGTGKIGIIGGVGGTMSLAANGGFSSISPFPWISSSIAGNAVCLDKSGSGNVSGTITYRGAP